MIWELALCLSASISVVAADSGTPEMCLCLDSMVRIQNQSGAIPEKLVYGYINGIKTPCMSENKFRTRYTKTVSHQNRPVELQSQNFANSGAKRQSPTMSIVELILRGKKDLAGADLRGYDLHGVDLTNADLRNANLESTDLRSAILKNANLSGANLENAYLKNSNFQNADLSGVRMRGAHLYRANLTGVRGLTLDCIGVANTAYNSIFDAELLEQVKKIYPTKLSDPGWEWQASVFTENTVIPKEQRVSAKQFH